MQRSLLIAVLVLAAAAGARSANAQDTTYGQDPVPDSQFWSGTVPQGYGIDLVPAQVETIRPYRVEYGLDPIPNSRIYDSWDKIGPRLSTPGQVLTETVEDEACPARPNPTRQQPR